MELEEAMHDAGKRVVESEAKLKATELKLEHVESELEQA